MNLLTNSKRRVAAAIIVGGTLVAGGGAAAYAASASTGSPSTGSTSTGSPSTGSTSTAPGAARAEHRSVLKRADHASLEVREQGRWVTINVDRGNVTVASTTSITLARPDGQSVTIALAPSTKYGGKEATSAAALKTGVRVRVTSINGTALRVTEGSKPLPTK
jgi:hypothetical protein